MLTCRRQDNPDPNLFVAEVRNCAGNSVSLTIWTAKVRSDLNIKVASEFLTADGQGQRTHSISIPVSKENPTLGLTLQFAPLSVTHHIWHVLSIPSPQSPAYLAGLLEHSDYILGSPSGTLRGESALSELIEDHLNRTLVLWVYNSEFDVVREVELVPSRGWGGEGALGAVLGYGALHRLPVGLGEEVEGPGEVVFETQDDGNEKPRNSESGSNPPASEPSGGSFFVPANLTSAPPLTSQAPRSSKDKRKHRHAGPSPNRAFDEYFAESEQKSKEQDYIPSRKGTPLPPPPKAGPRPPSPPRPGPPPTGAENTAPAT